MNEEFEFKEKELIKKLHEFQEKKNIENQSIILFKLAQLYYNSNEFEKAKLELKNILKIKPNSEKANYYLAQISIAEGNINLAIKKLNDELKINPKDENSLILRKKLIINNNYPIITILLIILNSIIFYFTYPRINFIETIKFGLNSNLINYSHLISSLFFHLNYIHFFSNMIILLMFGLLLEKQIGSLKFLLIYLISGIIGNLIQVLTIKNSFVIGASGAIFGIIGSILLLKPNLKLKLFGFINIPIIILFGGFFIFSSLITNIFLKNIYIGDISHIFGFLTGILITGILYKENIKIFYSWIIISIGFIIINYGINYFIKLFKLYSENNTNIFNNTIIYSLLIYSLLGSLIIIIGSLLIHYSYKIINQIEFEV